MFAALALGAWLAAASLAGAAQVPVPAPAASAAKPAEALLPTPQFTHFDMADGLPSSSINAVVQDHRGFMWFGGSGGLSRYDGVEFRTYKHEPDNPDSLSSNDITQLVCARDDRVWIATGDSGVDRLDPATGKFEHWRHDPHDPHSLANDLVTALALGPDGSLWIGTRGGLDRLAPDGKRITHVAYLPAIGGGTGNVRDSLVGALHFDADGTLWIGTWSGLLLKRLPDGRFVRVPVDWDSMQGSLQIWRINGSGKHLRIGTRAGLMTIGADGVARRKFSLDQMPQGYVFDSARDASGRLWMATLDGVVMDDPATGLHRFGSQPLLVGGLPGQWTWRVVRDREGGMWFTFYDGGVAYLGPGWEGFSRYTHIPDDPTSLRDVMASVVAPSADGKLWVGERGKLDKLDPTTGKVEHIPGNLGSEAIVILDTGKTVWATTHGQLWRYQGGKLGTFAAGNPMLRRPAIVTQGNGDDLYVSVLKYGVVKLDTRTAVVTPVPMPPDATDVDDTPSVLSFRHGVLWYANAEGLLRWDANLDRMGFVPGVARGTVVGATDFDRPFWLVREDALEHYHWDGARAVRDRVVGAAQGWDSPVTMGLEEDATGKLWIFTRTGLLSYAPATGVFRRYGRQEGLANEEFQSDGAQLSPRGPFYAANQAGVIGFNPLTLRDHAVTPLLAVTAIAVRGERGVRQLPTSTRDVHLGWNDRDLRVSVRALSYVDPRANRYRFRLAGLDDGWVDTGNHGDREFVGLRPGRYILRVEAAGAGGRWGGLDVPLQIRVAAPPWLRWWAWTLYALAFVLVAGWMLWAWRRRIAQRHRMALSEQARVLAEQTSAAKTQFLATLSHEIRTPMTGVMGMAELLLDTPLDDRQRGYTQAMQRSGGMLLKLLNDALDLVRIDAGRFTLEIAPYAPRQMVEEVAQLEQGVAWSKGLRFEVDVEGLPAQVRGDVVRIKQVLLNLVGNALKFTEHGSVTLRARRADAWLVFSVIDTGPGIPEASQARLFERFEQEDSPQRRVGSGLGLAICRELVTMMGGSIELQSRLGHGSSFIVRLPFDEVTLPPQAPGVRAARRGLQVLLVEDDPTVAAVIVGMLQAQGQHVVHVGDGLQGLAELERGRLDAVLLDLDLPGIDGFQVARLMRQHAAGAQLPIIAVTARSAATDEAEAQRAGMDGFLRKPLTGAELAAMLNRVLDADRADVEPTAVDPA
ncbi:MAG: hybrid sensor histidine kinase/response regulator [Rhodanobacter sp.]|nr:MAG: hybrid sensor histidine kinase/response regulator [Rhodanobacter sp.]TAM37774.1 MAG: hybrid sensor histidine kinase/response regulator [Rhodanobacter sp.]